MPDATAGPTVLPRLAELVGAADVLVDADLTDRYARDVTGRFAGRPLAVVRPADGHEVERVVALCAAHGVALVTQGGHTGLAGAATPRDGELVLSTERLDDVGELDAASLQIEVGAGTPLARVQAAARAHGLSLPIDLGARDSATVGGMVATDAGGPLAVRFGTMRDRVAGLEAVLGTGRTVSRLAGLRKDNAGYDWPQLLVGSEGTLGVITRVRLALVRRAPHRVVALVGVADPAAAVSLLGRLRDHLGDALEACDFLDAAAARLSAEHRSAALPLPGRHGTLLVVEAAAEDDPTERLAYALAGADAVVGTSQRERDRLWAVREGVSEAVISGRTPHKHDVSIPIRAIPAFCAAIGPRVRAIDRGAEVVLYGHLGDGNVHVNVLGPAGDDDRTDAAVTGLVVELGGSISAEHGIGVLKAHSLSLVRSPAEIETMRAIKAALDPGLVLAPGRVLAETA